MTPERENKCFTCSRTTRNTMKNVLDIDSDEVTYWEKLRYCFQGQLHEEHIMKICRPCITNLRIAYTFHETVMKYHELRRQESVLDAISADDIVDDIVLSMPSPQSLCHINDVEATDENESTQAYLIENIELERKRQFTDHKLDKKHLCCYCGKEFKQFSRLKEHQHLHTGEKNYQCPVCGKQYVSAGSEKRHRKSHEKPPGHKAKRTPFLCTICGKTFPFSNTIQRHMRIHKGIRKFECAVCHRKFSEYHHLSAHMRTHTGEKPYTCDICGERFTLSQGLQKHFLTRHLNDGSVKDELKDIPD